MPEKDGLFLAPEPGTYTRLLQSIPVLREGKFRASTGAFEISGEDVPHTTFGINSRAKSGVPVALKYTHATGAGGIESVGVGFMDNARDVGGRTVADLHITNDARVDSGDGRGLRTVATVDTIADQLASGIMHLSIEANRNAKRPGYYDERTLALEPVAWAVLPPGVLPAVPPIAAASSAGGYVVFDITAEGGDEMEELEALKAQVQKLQEENASLKAQLKEQEDAKAEADKKAEAEKVAEETKEVAEQLPEGARDKFTERVEAKSSPAEKRAVLAEAKAMLEAGLIVGTTTASGEVFASGSVRAGQTTDPQKGQREAHVKGIMDENPGMLKAEAELESLSLCPELWPGEAEARKG